MCNNSHVFCFNMTFGGFKNSSNILKLSHPNSLFDWLIFACWRYVEIKANQRLSSATREHFTTPRGY